MRTLNVIGAGRVGSTLAALWHRCGAFAVQDIFDRTEEGGREAVAFVGAGRPVDALATMHGADVWMITTPDRHIAGTCDALAASGALRARDVVFHCSGSIASSALSAASAAGAHVASVHPLKTFAAREHAVRTFDGTYCAAEGHSVALAVLVPAFEHIGARVARIDPAQKTLYHAASVIVCNDLVALMEAGLRCSEKAGIDRETAAKMIEPLVRETVDNVFKLGTTQSLTGPVARGDAEVVGRHLEALIAWDAEVAAIYRALGLMAAQLARAQGNAGDDVLRLIEGLFKQ